MASDLPPPPSPVRFRKLWDLVRPYLGPVLLVNLLILVGSGVGLVALSVAGWVVDAALQRSTETLNRIALLLVGLFAGLGLLTFVEHYLLVAVHPDRRPPLTGEPEPPPNINAKGRDGAGS